MFLFFIHLHQPIVVNHSVSPFIYRRTKTVTGALNRKKLVKRCSLSEDPPEHTIKMEGVATNFGTTFENESLKMFNNTLFGVGSNYLSSLGSNNAAFVSSGSASLPNFNSQLGASLSTWYEIGPSSLTTFDQSWESEKSSADTGNSNQHSLGSQEWGQMIDEVILNELVTLKESVDNK